MLTGEQSKGIIYHNVRIVCKLKLKEKTGKKTGKISVYRLTKQVSDDKLSVK